MKCFATLGRRVVCPYQEPGEVILLELSSVDDVGLMKILEEECREWASPFFEQQK
jgi:hypothetical protein